jgi:hypothetical protein
MMVERIDPYSPRTQPPQYGVIEADLPDSEEIESVDENNEESAEEASHRARTDEARVEERKLEDTQKGRYIDLNA